MDVPAPIPLSESTDWKKIAAEKEAVYREALKIWSAEKTRLLARIQILTVENRRLRGTEGTSQESSTRLKF
jgi:hypothetical protein